jgi:ATP/maltotriose-dependent transcriptional regulator MalT
VPAVLEILLRDPRDKHRVRLLVQDARDEDLVRALGVEAIEGDRRELLSPREREVYRLLCEGLSNRQIASILVISPSTAKLHVQHVYDKLGVHSRKALAVQAAVEHSRQATSATRGVDSASSEV